MQKFDLEQKILTCWGIVDDIELLRRMLLDGPKMTEDQIDNFLLGLSTIYSGKFGELFSTFEKMLKEQAKKSLDTESEPDSEFFQLKKYPDYYWDSTYKELYSMKSGSLKKLKLQKSSRYSPFDHYIVYDRGFAKKLSIFKIEELILDRK